MIWDIDHKIVSKRIDIDGIYLIANEIVISPKNETFAMTYNDDGNFMLIVFSEDDIRRKFLLSRIVNLE